MISSFDISSDFALDVASVGRLRLQSKQDPQAGIRAAAQQFEALFISMMLKSMRAATPQNGLLDNNQTNLYTEFLDQQMAQKLGSMQGLGLADMMVKQLSRSQGVQAAPAPVPGAPQSGPSEVVTKSDGASGASAPEAFVNQLWQHAKAAGLKLGVPPHFLIGHAALETGWGKHQIVGENGENSHNLFGVKAGADWKGPVVEAETTEYVQGVPYKTVQRFRSYGSYEEAFKDYIQLLRKSPRYAGLFQQNLDAAGFAQGLQQAGYATDPLYADKLVRVLNSRAMREALAA